MNQQIEKGRDMDLRRGRSPHRRGFRRLLSVEAAIAALSLVAIYGVFAGSQEGVLGPLRGTAIEPWLHAGHIGNAIVFDLSVGFLVSVFFWVLVVEIPARQRRALLRDNLRNRYRRFREQTLSTLLFASDGSHPSTLPRELLDPARFRDYFGSNGSQRWYASLNGLQPHHLSDIKLELELLRDEVRFVLSQVAIRDARVHEFFGNFAQQIHRLSHASVYGYDPVKYLGSTLWGLHARFDVIDGQREDDIIETMIDAIE